MPTIISHAAVPIALAIAFGPKRIAGPVFACGLVLSMLPDADVVGFKLGVQYADTWGHRGATHSVFFAGIMAAILTPLFRLKTAVLPFLFLWISMASHGLLDALTNGGLGPALLWPFDNARIFAPFTPINVSPIGIDIFNARGLRVLTSELQWIWVPAAVVAGVGYAVRTRRAAR
jgi:inner membrane protein